MHDRDPFRAPRREPKPGTLHHPAHGFGTKPAPEAAELRLSGPMVGEQKLGREHGNCPLALPEEEKAVTRPAGRLPPPADASRENARRQCRRASSGRKRRAARAARTRTSCRNVDPGEH
jgi:hypothetical protein